MRVYRRGRVYYSDIIIPGHPKADDAGRVRIPLDSDRRLAESKLADMAKLRDDKRYGRAPRGIAWADWKLIWDAHASKSFPTETYLRQVAAIKVLERLMPIMRLEQLTPEQLSSMMGDMRQEGYEPAGRNRVLGSWRTMLKQAAEWKYIEPQEWDGVERAKTTAKAPRYYSVADYTVMLQAAAEYSEWSLTTAVLGWNMGLRPGEIYFAHRAGVDFDHGKWGRYWVKEVPGFIPKDYEERWIEMNEPVSTYIRALLKRMPESCQYLLGPGRPISRQSFSKGFGKMLAHAKLPGSMHRLRHSFAVHLALANVNLKKIQKMMGHKRLSTTEIYLEIYPDDLSGAVDAIPRVVPPFVPGRGGKEARRVE